MQILRMCSASARATLPGTTLLFVLLALVACGATPQAPAAQSTATPAAAAPAAPSSSPGPDADAAPTAYPAPGADANAAPTAYPAPLGGAPQDPASTAAPAPTRPPLAVTAAPAATGSPAMLPALPAGMNVGEVPKDLALVAVSDLVQRTGAAPNTISVVSGEAVEWPDGAVGCPKPGMMYPQVITPGYKLVLAVSGREYNYHASERGQFFLCER